MVLLHPSENPTKKMHRKKTFFIAKFGEQTGTPLSFESFGTNHLLFIAKKAQDLEYFFKTYENKAFYLYF